MNELIYHQEMLTAREVSRLLSVSVSMVYRLMQTGDIRTVSIGKSKRVRLEDLYTYINENLSPNKICE